MIPEKIFEDFKDVRNPLQRLLEKKKNVRQDY